MAALLGFGSGVVGSLVLIALFRLWARRTKMPEWLFAVPFGVAATLYVSLLWTVWPWLGVWSISIVAAAETFAILFLIRRIVKRGQQA